MIITFIYSNYPQDQIRVQLRCRNFVDAINRNGSHSANLLDLQSFIQNTPDAQALCSSSDILVINRYLYGPVLRAVQYWKARDKKVVVDFDQAINLLTPGTPGYSFWMEGVPLEDKLVPSQQHQLVDPVPLEQFKWGLRLVDAVIVPTARLADDWSQFTTVLEIPDYLNTDQYPALKHEREDEIWLGLSDNTKYNGWEISGFLQAVRMVCAERPAIKIVIPATALQPYDRINVPASQVIQYQSDSFDAWAHILPRLDIGLSPMIGDYDLRCSGINLLEFMVSKVPWIASDLLTFRSFASYGTLVQNNVEDWRSAMMNSIDQISLYRKKASAEPFLFALSQDINGNIEKVLKVYTSILYQA
jgi:hypothetical protein